MRKTTEWVRANLLLEQIIERLPCTAGTQGGWRGRFLLPRHADLIKRAVVALVFLRDAHFHRLHALKMASRIEIHALLAGMQLKPALRALPLRRHSLQHRSTLRATRHRPRPRQIDGPRAERVVLPGRRRARPFSRRPRLLSRSLARLMITILIPMLTVFSQRPSQARDVLSPLRIRFATGRVPHFSRLLREVGIFVSHYDAPVRVVTMKPDPTTT